MSVEKSTTTDNPKLDAAIDYFEDAVRESDEIIADCSPDLQAELTKQKGHFVVALEVLRRIAEDDKAREAGRLVVLPCNTGDTLFVADRYKGKIYNRTVERFTVGKNGYLEIWVGTTISVNAKQLGKTVFLARQEAEAALGGVDGG